jgi:hypothetical protein
MLQALVMVSFLAAFALTLAAPESPRAPASPDKASIFGSALLVPTPEGERARTELAIAGEIEKTLAAMPAVRKVRASVTMGTSCQAVLSISADASDAGIIEAAARMTVPALSGCATPPLLLLSSPPPRDDSLARPLPWPLALSLLSLGVCLGIIAERLRLRVHRNADDMR